MVNLLKKMVLVIVYGAGNRSLSFGVDKAFKPIRAKFLIGVGKVQFAFFSASGPRPTWVAEHIARLGARGIL